VIARTEEFAFHKINDLQWRFGVLEDGHSTTILNSEKNERVAALMRLGFVIVRQDEHNHFVVLGRTVEVDLDPVVL